MKIIIIKNYCFQIINLWMFYCNVVLVISGKQDFDRRRLSGTSGSAWHWDAVKPRHAVRYWRSQCRLERRNRDIQTLQSNTNRQRLLYIHTFHVYISRHLSLSSPSVSDLAIVKLKSLSSVLVLDRSTNMAVSWKTLLYISTIMFGLSHSRLFSSRIFIS